MIVQNPASKPGPSKVKISRSASNRDRNGVSRSKRREIEAERREYHHQSNLMMKQKRDEIVLRNSFKIIINGSVNRFPFMFLRSEDLGI